MQGLHNMKQVKNIILFLICFHCFESNAQTISGIVNSYFKATYYSSKYNGLKLPGFSGLAKGDKVLIIQMKGAVIDETNTASFGNITSLNGAGQYEFATICGFVNDTVGFDKILLNTYDFTKAVQVVRIPVYTDVTITGTLMAQPWDSVTGTGGVIALEATGTIAMNANIDANGAGFKGGQMFVNTTNRSCPTPNYYYSILQSTSPSLGASPKGEGIAPQIINKEHGVGKQANGGGGGNLDNNGGGGGSNFGNGGVGGRKPLPFGCTFLGIPAAPNAQGGFALNTSGYSLVNNRIFLGGGGGCGEMNNYENPPTNTIPSGTPGGNGGGIVYIKCNQVIGNSFFITANGNQGLNASLSPSNASKSDGAGGGGGGGVVLLNCNSYSGTLTVEAKGGGGCNAGFSNQCGMGPGGGGGGGVIWYTGILTASTNISGGANGIITSTGCSNTPNGAVSGNAGSVQNGFVATQGTVSFNCSILPSAAFIKFDGRKFNDGILLSWKLEQANVIEEIWLEKKSVRGPFKTLKVFDQPTEGSYTYTDVSNEFPATYRLMQMDKMGAKLYSNEIFFEREKVKRLHVYPNPVSNELRIELPVTSFSRTAVAIFDYTGKLVASKEIMLTANQQYTTVETSHLPAGTYTVKCYWRDELYIAKIIKQ